MGIFYTEQEQDRDATFWGTTVDEKEEIKVLPLGLREANTMSRPEVGQRRFSWMDQIQAKNTRGQSNSELHAGSEYDPSYPWGPQSPSSLRATAAIWTPSLPSSEADEYITESDVTERLEAKFAATSIGDPLDRTQSSTAGSSDTHQPPSSWPISISPEGFSNPKRHSRHDSSTSDTSRSVSDDLRQRTPNFPQQPLRRAGSMAEPGNYTALNPLTTTISAPSVGANPKRGGLPELRTTALSDFRLDDVQGPLATDDSLYAVVEFKLFRAEVYQLRRDWIGGAEGVCLVIVEADRGVDLGKVHHITADAETAREMKRALNRRHWSALLQNSATSKPSEEESEIAFKQVYEWTASSPFAGGFTAGDGTMPPRSIVRKANRMEISQLQFKEGLEERARRLCWQKAKDHGFTMEILAAEFQFDHQKLTFYFLAPGYVAFNPLINELYKIFKTRIWFVPLNPASFVNPTSAGHTPSSSASEHFPGSPHSAHPGPKGHRRDSRSHPVQNIAPGGPPHAGRHNVAPGAGRPSQMPAQQSYATANTQWHSNPGRGAPQGDWPRQFSPLGYKSPQTTQGPWN